MLGTEQFHLSRTHTLGIIRGGMDKIQVQLGYLDVFNLMVSRRKVLSCCCYKTREGEEDAFVFCFCTVSDGLLVV